MLNVLLLMPLIAAEPAAAEAEAKPQGIAVFDLEPVNGVSAGLAKLLTESLLTRLNASRRFASVVGGSDIRAMLDMEQQKQVLGCGDEECLAELGGALGVPLMMNPTLGLVGKRFVLNLKVIAVEEAKAKARVEGVFESEGDILNGLPKLVDQLLAQLAGDLPPVAAPVSTRRRLMTRVGAGVSLVGALGIAYGFYAAKQAEDALPSVDKVTPADAQNFEANMGVADLVAVAGWSLLGAGVAVRFIP
jgi:hypothetical protein